GSPDEGHCSLRPQLVELQRCFPGSSEPDGDRPGHLDLPLSRRGRRETGESPDFRGRRHEKLPSHHGVILAMISPITRKIRGPVRPGLMPLAAIALITTSSASYFIPMRKPQLRWEGLSTAAVRRASFDVWMTVSGVAQSSQQKVFNCQLENLR